MKINEALESIQRLYVETAPFIYHVEDHPSYAEKMANIFAILNYGTAEIVTSAITLTETLTKPLKAGDITVAQAYLSLLQNTQQITLTPITADIAIRAANIRAPYNLRTPDALHIATAIEQRCDAFLTNDFGLRRIKTLRVLVLDELQLD